MVIIGGGIVGSSIAYYLTESGCRDVIVVERESHQGKGSTGKSMGGVRAQFSTIPSIQMSLYSILFLRDFEARTGHPSGYRGGPSPAVRLGDTALGSARENRCGLVPTTRPSKTVGNLARLGCCQICFLRKNEVKK